MQTPKISKRQRKREIKAQHELEMKQLANSSLPSCNINNPQIGLITISKKQEEKEQKTRKWMNEKSIDFMFNPEKHKTKGAGNSPRSTWDKLQTAHTVSRDKYTCSSIAEYEKKNTRVKFNTGKNMPVKRVSATSGIGQVSFKRGEEIRAHNAKIYGKPEEKKETYIEENPNRFNDTVLEKKNQHELK